MTEPDDHIRRRTIAGLREQLGVIVERPPGDAARLPGAAQAPTSTPVAADTAAEPVPTVAQTLNDAHIAEDPHYPEDRASEDSQRRPKGSIEDSALSKLAAAPTSCHQLTTHLVRRGYPEPQVADLINRYTQVGLLNDSEYAHMVVRSAATGRAKARPALARELHAAGIDRDTAQAALEAIDDATEHATACAYVAKKLPGLTRHPPHVIMRRLASQLARRGYTYETSMAVITEALHDAGIEATSYPT